jgi:hypothetical protein
MKKRPRSTRLETWNRMSAGGTGLCVAGVAGKAFVVPGLILAVFGAMASVAFAAMGAVVAMASLGLWVYASRTIGRRVGLSVGRAMWALWTVPTWSVVGDLFDILP